MSPLPNLTNRNGCRREVSVLIVDVLISFVVGVASSLTAGYIICKIQNKKR